MHKLRNAINDYEGGNMLGSTIAGSNWARRALDPSDVLADVSGIPDITSGEIGIEKYQQTIFIRSPTTTNPNELFDIEIRQTGHPVAPFDIFIRAHSDPGNLGASFTYLNDQIDGGDPIPYFSGTFAARQTATTAAFTAKCNSFTKMYQKARLLYQGLTLNQIAASLSNQGQIIAVQQDFNPSVSYPVVTDGSTTYAKKTFKYSDNDFPTINNAANLSRVYQEASEGGVYMPLHLSINYKDFINMEDKPYLVSDLVPEQTAGQNIPHLFCAVTNGTQGIPPMNDTAGSIFILGVSPGTTFQCKYMAGFEGLPYAGSSSTTHLQRSPAHDALAMEVFAKLTRDVVMDAYPADWNFLGKLGSWLRTAASKIIPMIAPAIQGYSRGGIGGAIAGVAPQVLDMINPPRIADVLPPAGLPGPEGFGSNVRSKRDVEMQFY